LSNGKIGQRKIGQQENWATKKGVIGINGNICVTAEKNGNGKIGQRKKGQPENCVLDE